MQKTPSPKSNSKAFTFLVIAMVLVVVLAFTWAIDISIIYILSGAIVFSLFMAVYSWPAKQVVNEDDSHYLKNEKNTQHDVVGVDVSDAEPAKVNFDQLFEQIVEQKKATVQGKQQNKQKSGNQSSKPATAKSGCLIFTVIGFVVFMIGMFVLFNFDDEAESGFVEDGSEENADSFSQAESYYYAGDYEQAYTYYKSALSENAKNTNALLGLGNTFAALNNNDSALFYYQQCIVVDDNFDVARYNIGWLNYRNKSFEEAVRALKLLIDRNPKYLDAFQLLGDVYYEQEKYDDALIYYERAYMAGQRNNWICYVTAYLYQTKGDNQTAITRYKEALTYDSTVVDIYKRLGEIVPGSEGVRYRERGEGRQW